MPRPLQLAADNITPTLANPRFFTRDTSRPSTSTQSLSCDHRPLRQGCSPRRGEGAGITRELDGGSSTAGVVSLETSRHEEGNGLSRHIDLRGGGGNDAHGVRVGRYTRRAMYVLRQRLYATSKSGIRVKEPPPTCAFDRFCDILYEFSFRRRPL